MPLITISRGIGCGGLIVARRVAEGLNLELFDDRRLQEEAIKLGLQMVTETENWENAVMANALLHIIDLLESV